MCQTKGYQPLKDSHGGTTKFKLEGDTFEVNDVIRIPNENKTGNREDGPMTPDPWKHRSRGMCCASCMWFVEKVKSDPTVPRKIFGRCRRHAPSMTGYPAVFGSDWCGDHKLDENKI